VISRDDAAEETGETLNDSSFSEESLESSVAEEMKMVRKRPPFLKTEDWWAVWLGGAILLMTLGLTWSSRPADQSERLTRFLALTERTDTVRRQSNFNLEELKELEKERDAAKAGLTYNPLKSRIGKIGKWESNPLDAFVDSKGRSIVPGLLAVLIGCCFLFSIGIGGMGESVPRFVTAFVPVFLLAIISFVLAGQRVINDSNLEYALWAILIGLLISNTLGTPRFLKPAIRTEFYIKTGLVLLGAEILFSQLLALGLPGICISWVVTPVVLISTFIFGQKVLKMSSPSLNMVISADMSVCGVSAAIATGAACRAKREELSLAIALSLGFTVIMMILMPEFIKLVGMDEVVAGAWLGGTIDSTGAVAAAGGMVGDAALTVATTIKMIQNILIGVVAFCVSIYWVGWVEKSPNGERVRLVEIWRRFPKFMFGFLAASLVFSFLTTQGPIGESTVSAVLDGTTKLIRNWLFCLAFVSIGLETNFRELLPYFKGGKPLTLYVVGQTLNLVLSLFMSWLILTKVFPNAADALR